MAQANLNVLLLSLGIFVPFNDCTTTRVSEAINHEVTVVFYLISKSTFTAKRDEFRTLMADGANSYCQDNYLECGLQSGWNRQGTFEMVDVEIIKEDDAVEKARLHVSYYINLPRNITVTRTNYVLNKNAAENAVAATRKDIHKGMGYSIIKAGTSEFSPYPDVVLNAVMITFGLLFTLACLTVLLCCRYHKKKEEKKIKRKQAIEAYKETHPKRPSTAARLSPSHGRVRPEDARTISTNILSEKPVQEVNYPRPYRRGENRSKPNEEYGRYDSYNSPDTYHIPQPTEPTTLNVSSSEHATSSDDAYRNYYSYGPQQDQPRTLEPLNEEELRRQKKKAKKAMKKQMRREAEAAARMREGSYENGSYTVTEPRYRPPGPDADGYNPSPREMAYRPESAAAMNIPPAVTYDKELPVRDNTNSDNSDSGLNSTGTFGQSLNLKSTEV